MLYRRKIQPYLTAYSTQLLVEAMVISHLDYCSSLLASLLACALQAQQLFQDPAGWLVFSFPKFSCHSPAGVTLLVASRCQDQVLSLTLQSTGQPLLPTGYNSTLHSSSTTLLYCSWVTFTPCHPGEWFSLILATEHPSTPSGGRNSPFLYEPPDPCPFSDSSLHTISGLSITTLQGTPNLGLPFSLVSFYFFLLTIVSLVSLYTCISIQHVYCSCIVILML